MKLLFLPILLLVTFSLLISCATVKTEGIKSAAGSNLDQQENFEYPPFSGEAVRVQVMQFRIPQEIVENYPELAEKQVGLGLSECIVDELYDTKRFIFIEEKEQMQKKILEQWALSQSGIVTENQQIEAEGISAPRYLIYAQIIDFAVSHSEQIVGISLQKRATTRLALQLRFLDVSSGEYIPSSGTGEATTEATSLWINPDMPFDRTTVGLATQRATRNAVLQLLKRIDN